MDFAPYDLTVDRPNVVVDGSANASTVLVLSHWPGASCPPDLRRDLSAQSAMAYLDHVSRHGDAEVVTNNHFDQDGLMSVLALVDPVAARARADLVIEVARAGDFAVTASPTAARVSMAVAAAADPERSPLDPAVFAGDYPQTCGRLYQELLGRVVGWIDDPQRCRPLWADEDAQLDADRALMASDQVTIDEVPELDLSVVTLPTTVASSGGHRFGAMWSDLIHPLALHAGIDGMAVLLIKGDQVEFRYRYESWVQYQSRPVRPRVDLTAVAEELTALEPGSVEWHFSEVSSLTPELQAGWRPDRPGTTDLDPTIVRACIEHGMATLPPAFDPYSSASATSSD
jgi:hypothetical protein